MKKQFRVFTAIALAVGILFSEACAYAETEFPVSGIYSAAGMTELEKTNAAFSRKAAADCMVLLKNQNQTLPLKTDKPVALFGVGACETVIGGSGSGDVNERYLVNVRDGMNAAGFTLTTSDYLASVGEYVKKTRSEFAGRSWETQVIPELAIGRRWIDTAAGETDTAVYVIARASGEGADRTDTVGDFRLSKTEKENFRKLRRAFRNVIVILNSTGVVELSPVSGDEGADAILFMPACGAEAGNALADVLTGKVAPSGKLTDTWAARYSDYPASATFADHDGDVNNEEYGEGIYVGYRYFDRKEVKPAYAFGYGLSYTEFELRDETAEIEEDTVLQASAIVRNSGDTWAGRETVQLYISAPDGRMDKPIKELKGFQKTRILKPGEEERVEIMVPIAALSSWDEDHQRFVLEEGDYHILLGNSSDAAREIACLHLKNRVWSPEEEAQAWAQTTSENGKAGRKFSAVQKARQEDGSNKEKAAGNKDKGSEDVSVYVSDTTQREYLNENLGYSLHNPYTGETYKEKMVRLPGDFSGSTLIDVQQGRVSMEEFVSALTVEQMANLVIGGSKLPNANGQSIGALYEGEQEIDRETLKAAQKNSVQGEAGETAGIYISSLKIPNIVLADGPCGLRLTPEYMDENGMVHTQYCTAWPSNIALGSSWDPDLVAEVARHTALEMERFGVSVLLAPGMNIHRDPLGGRCFEYYSEDPILTGLLGAAYVRGIQEDGVHGACIKHFACNNQETNRTGESNAVDERTLREIYLRGFEIAIVSARPWMVMTSYNLNNQIPAADDYNLLTRILRQQWESDAAVVTDWGGGQSTPSISMHAGNDLIMPGKSIRDITVRAFSDEQPSFEDGKAYPEVKVLTGIYGQKTEAQWGEFVLSDDPSKGKLQTITRTVSQDQFQKETVLVSSEDGTVRQESLKKKLEEEPAARYEEKKNGTVSITYKGYYRDNNISLGDLQKSTIHLLRLIMKTTQFQKLKGAD